MPDEPKTKRVVMTVDFEVDVPEGVDPDSLVMEFHAGYDVISVEADGAAWDDYPEDELGGVGAEVVSHETVAVRPPAPQPPGGDPPPPVLAYPPGWLKSFSGGACLIGRFRLFGAEHFLTLIRVEERNGRRYAADSSYQEELDHVRAIYPYRLVTVRVPGHEGDYVAYSHPVAE